MVAFSPDEFKGRSVSQTMLTKGIKRADRTPIPVKTLSQPMSWSYCPHDAVAKKWTKVGRYFRCRYRQGVLVNRDGYYCYVPDLTN